MSYSFFPDMLLDNGQMRAWKFGSRPATAGHDSSHLLLIFFLACHTNQACTLLEVSIQNRLAHLELSSQAFVLHALIYRHLRTVLPMRAVKKRLTV